MVCLIFVDLCFKFFFFFKQKTEYEMRISDWSSDVCSSDLIGRESISHRRVVIVHPAIHLAATKGKARLQRISERPGNYTFDHAFIRDKFIACAQIAFELIGGVGAG